MDQLIPLVNKLQDVFSAIGHQPIDLPQITVVGSQSSGKSSVLEHIVGRDFLPRGAGICTRRPLVLQLYNTTDGVIETKSESPNSEDQPVEWGEFLHIPNKRFYDFGEIREEIVRETDRLTGKNKGISNKTINLKIFSPYVLNLTLVDLPGITKVPTGDQPENVEEQIRNMCLEFITNPNAIILAVTAANSDLVNSDGLKLARLVDPEGVRTIGVLTKVDIMDAGTDCTEILANHLVPLRKGYVAVISRSQKDIADNISVRQCLVKEEAFFASHAKYRPYLSKCGTKHLTRTLSQILIHHIRECLPEIRAKIVTLFNEVTINIDSLGESTDSVSSSDLGRILLRLLSTFSNNLNQIVEGNDSAGALVTSLDRGAELVGGARISYVFSEIFVKAIRQMNPFDGCDDVAIRTAIANANGARGPSLFVPEAAFELLVKKLIERLREPGLQCIDLVFDELQRMAYMTDSSEIARFPHLKDKVYEVVNKLLRNCLSPSQSMVNNLIDIELAYINTSHPDFIGGKQAVAQMNKKLNPPPPTATVVSNGSEKGAGSTATPVPGSAPAPAAPAAPATVNPPPPATITTDPGGGFFNLWTRQTQPATTSASTVPATSVEVNLTPSNSSQTSSVIIKLPAVPDRMRSSHTPSDREKVETELIKTLVVSYFDIVRKNFMDTVPKSIIHFLVNQFKAKLQNELVSQLYRDSSFLTELLRESDDVASRRRSYREMKDLLQRALEILNEVRDFNTFR